MDEKEPLERHVDGSGTYADPYRYHSNLLSMLGQMERAQSAHLGFPMQIAKVREKLVATNVTPEERQKLEERILELEYRWRWKHPTYLINNYFLVKASSYSFNPEESAVRKREEWLEQARKARDAFYEFAAEHLDLHAQLCGEVPPIEQMMDEGGRHATGR